jgi:Restriction endonuclease
MPYLRFSRARYAYTCARCSTPIVKSQPYFRNEPFPFARMLGTAFTRQLCLPCVLGPDNARRFLDTLSTSAQLPLGFELTPNGFLRFPPRVELVDLTPQIMLLLAREPERMRELSPEAFENLVCDRLDNLGFELTRVGSGTYRKDGGIDIVAWPRVSTVPYLMAVQAKHTASPRRKIGPAPVRDLLGTVQMHGFNIGLLVTNTTFTPDARWVAEQRPLLMRLRDAADLQRWLRNEYLREQEWRDIPTEIEVCPGVFIRLPR